jgi:tRNA1(Val) A37 N6-methylase TrmN6
MPEEALTEDALLGGRVRLLQPRSGYRAAIDPVLLAAFAPAAPGQSALDLGCGAGAVSLCLGVRTPGLDLHGLELQPDYAALARANAAANGLSLEVHLGDVLRPPAELRARNFDLVLANPPYHAPDAAAARDPGRDAAHREGAARLGDWIDAGLRRLVPKGTLVVVHLAARLGDLLGALDGRAGAVEILPVAPTAGAPATRVLVRARKGSRAPLRLLAPLALHLEGTGPSPRYTAEAEAVLRNGAGLPLDTRIGCT